MPQTEDALFYQLYFQEPGVAEAELERDARTHHPPHALLAARATRRRGGRRRGEPAAVGMVPRGGGFLSHTAEPPALPAWLTEADVDFYAGEFRRAGFRGGLNWYRNIDRNWELLAPFAGARVRFPRSTSRATATWWWHFRGMDQLIAESGEVRARAAPARSCCPAAATGRSRSARRRSTRR